MSNNPYRSPKAHDEAVAPLATIKLWRWSACSVAVSVLSLVMFYLYARWHWYRGPWEETLPGQSGFDWVTAVDGSKACSVLLAVVSLVITIAIFRKRGYLQGLVSLPTCLLSLLTVPAVT